MKLQEDKSGRFNITVPIGIVRAKGWKKGENMEWNMRQDGTLEIKEGGDK